MPVHPQVARYLDEIAQIDLPPFEEMTPEFVRSTLTPSPEPHLPADRGLRPFWSRARGFHLGEDGQGGSPEGFGLIARRNARRDRAANLCW